MDGRRVSSRIGKGTFLTPVFTLVIYTGEKPWDGPRSLHDMLRMEETLAPYIPDYRLNLLDMGHDEAIPYRTQCLADLAYVLRTVYSERFDDRTLVSNAALSLAGILTGNKFLYDRANEDKGGSRVMCEALDKLERRGFTNGIILARKVLQLAAEGLTEEQIARKCEVSLEDVHAVLTAGDPC